ncbi:MAG: hypothetical protein KJN79_09860 [Gammaproteobacteria bacterium]|nr:hypothetical protein [Gammaproteobacteria bacterium]
MKGPFRNSNMRIPIEYSALVSSRAQTFEASRIPRSRIVSVPTKAVSIL